MVKEVSIKRYLTALVAVLLLLFLALGFILVGAETVSLETFLFVGLAFVLGAFCTLMPCCLPVLPAYMGVLAERGGKKISKQVSIFLLFYIPLFIAIFIIGLIFATIARETAVIEWLKYVAGIFIFIIGTDMLLGAYKLPNINIMGRIPAFNVGKYFKFRRTEGGLPALGFLLGIASSPCAILIMSPILAYSLTVQNFLWNLGLFISYALGRGLTYFIFTVPFILGRKEVFVYVSKHTLLVKKIVATIILIAGFFLVAYPFLQREHHAHVPEQVEGIKGMFHWVSELTPAQDWIIIGLFVLAVFFTFLIIWSEKKKKKEEKYKDPVCGMEVHPKSAIKDSYKRKEIFFCSKTCQQRFKEEPEKYG